MGKSLKGKELGVGIHQEKSGLYTARYVNRFGKRVTKRFKKLQECRKWIAEETYKNEHSKLSVGAEILMDEWFNIWISYKEKIVKPNTSNTYRSLYIHHIKDRCGNMLLSEIKYRDYENLLLDLAKSGYSRGTISHVNYVFSDLFNYGIQQDIITESPVKKISLNIGIPEKETVVLTLEEQKIFLKAAKNTNYYDDFRFVLLTGIRVGELRGLQWDDIDFNNKRIQISRTVYYLNGEWISGRPKTEKGYRTIPLTEEALEILKSRKKRNEKIKNIPEKLKQTVFIRSDGELGANASYNYAIKTICEKANISIISMHSLRHTFATRCIEAGMNPKTLQVILGHSNISITMNLYVHVNESTKERELLNVIKFFENLN